MGEIWAGWDGEQQHHKDGAYLAFLSTDYGKEARGVSIADAVEKLRKKYPETKDRKAKSRHAEPTRTRIR